MNLETAAPRGRLNELTAVRGLAALMVVAFHARGSWHPIFEGGEGISMIVATGWMWVHFFFVLSGFVMMEAYGRDFAGRVHARAYWRFIVTRFGRIYPLHLFTLGVMATLFFLRAIEVVNPDGSFAASLALTQGFTYVPLVWNGPAWSISTEWYVYLIFPLLVPVAMRLPTRALRAIWVALALGVVFFFTHDGGGEDWPLGRLVLCLIEFLLGCATHRLIAGHAWPHVRRRAAATLIFVMPIALLALPRAFDNAWIHAIVAVGFALSIGVLAAERTYVDDLLNGRLLQFLGLISYSIYLNHEILYSLARTAADAWLGRPHALHNLPTLWALALFPIYLAILIGVSWATWRWIEEPLRAWFKRRARGGQSVDRLLSADRSDAR